MWHSSSIVDVKLSSLYNLLGKTKAFTYTFSRNFGFSCSSVLQDDDFVPEHPGYTNNVSSPNATGNPSSSRDLDDISCEVSDFVKFVRRDTLTDKNVKEDVDKIKAIKRILRKRSWILDSQIGFSCDLDQFKVIRILNDLFEESSDASLALYFFRWSELCLDSEHSMKCISRMIHILISGNMNHRAVALLLRLVRNCSGEERSCSLILSILYEVHTDRRVLETIFSMLVDCCIKENRVDMAMKLTYQMEQLGFFPSRGVCNSLLRELLRLSRLEPAWEFLECMLSRGMHLNASTISLFVDRYCSDRNFEVGLKLIMEMKYHGIKPDVVTYTILIDNLCKVSCLREATTLLFKMIELGISPDSVSISSVIHHYCKVGYLEEAIKIVKFFDLKPNVFVYNSVLSKLCTEGNMVKASRVFDEILDSGLLPDCVCYTTIIGGYCKVGDMSKALQYFGRLLKSGNPPSVVTYTLLIDACCKSGDIGEAQFLFQNMKAERLVPDVVTYNTLMHGYGKGGQLNKVFELLDMMRSAGIPPDVATYNILIHSMVTRGYVNEAKDILDELIRRGFMPDVATFTDLIGGFSQRRNFEEAFLLWFYMSDLQVQPDVVTCSALLNGYCRARCMDEANALFHKMLDAGLEPDLILCNTLIHGFCSIGDIDKASDMVNLMVRKGILPNDVTHRALVLGFEKKWVKDPIMHASLSLEEVLLRHGIDVDKVQFSRRSFIEQSNS